MAEGKHTAPPWVLAPDFDGEHGQFSIREGHVHGPEIAMVVAWTAEDRPEAAANAHLIAAAPDLYAAALKAITFIRSDEVGYAELRGAIAKAEGRS